MVDLTLKCEKLQQIIIILVVIQPELILKMK